MYVFYLVITSYAQVKVPPLHLNFGLEFVVLK